LVLQQLGLQDGHLSTEPDQSVSGLSEPEFGVLPRQLFLATESGVFVFVGVLLGRVQICNSHHPAAQVGQWVDLRVDDQPLFDPQPGVFVQFLGQVRDRTGNHGSFVG